MHPIQYAARIFLFVLLAANYPSVASCEPIQTFTDSASGISVMVPAGYSARFESAAEYSKLLGIAPKKDDVAILLTSKNSIPSYCYLSFVRTTVPDKWARDKSKTSELGVNKAVCRARAATVVDLPLWREQLSRICLPHDDFPCHSRSRHFFSSAWQALWSE